MNEDLDCQNCGEDLAEQFYYECPECDAVLCMSCTEEEEGWCPDCGTVGMAGVDDSPYEWEQEEG